MNKTKAFAAHSAKDELKTFEFTQREMLDDDVLIEILYCGVCHSDVHQARDEWGETIFPIVPGHEIIGKVTKVGSKVTKFKVGDYAGVGCMVGSCGGCKVCAQKEEQHCNKTIYSYNSFEKKAGRQTFGGYSTEIISSEEFVFTIGHNLAKNLPAAAPLLCAGITTYSPLKRWGVKKGDRVAIMGLGGLGHMAIKFASSFGADVTVISTSKTKEADAKKLGAHNFIVLNKENTSSFAGKFDVIINTISANINYNEYLAMLDVGGKMILLGIQPEPSTVAAFHLIGGRRILTGSLIGGTTETQEMLDYCDKHNIFSEVEIIKMEDVNKSYQRMLKSDVKYRFVIDIKGSNFCS